jgi:hypothetical protein
MFGSKGLSMYTTSLDKIKKERHRHETIIGQAGRNTDRWGRCVTKLKVQTGQPSE